MNCRVTTATGQTLFNTNDAAQFGNVVIGEGKLEFRTDRPPANQPNGNCSVSLGWWTPKSGASIPIGAVLTTAKSNSSADTSTTSASFGPVIETVVETSDWQRGYDLDTGRMMEAGSQRQHSGADLVVAQTTTGTGGLYFVGTRAEHFPDGEARWNMAAWIVATNLALIPAQIDAFTNADGFSHTAALMPKDSSHPETYLFRTLQGGMGVLQITGFTGIPRPTAGYTNALDSFVPADVLEAYAAAVRGLDELHKRERELLLRYTENHPLVVAARHNIVELQKKRTDIEHTHPGVVLGRPSASGVKIRYKLVQSGGNTEVKQ